MTDAVAAALAAIDTDRLDDLVAQVCRIPSVLGDEGPLASFLHDLMKESGFEATALQPVVGNRPNALGELAFGPGRRVVFTGHMDTKPVSHGWTVTAPFSGEIIDGSVYGHGIMDMKAALVCQIVAMEALRDSGVPLAGTLAMAAVSDHMGDQLGSIAYFDSYPADLAVLGELSDSDPQRGGRPRPRDRPAQRGPQGGRDPGRHSQRHVHAAGPRQRRAAVLAPGVRGQRERGRHHDRGRPGAHARPEAADPRRDGDLAAGQRGLPARPGPDLTIKSEISD